MANNNDALDLFIKRKAQIDRYISRLEQASHDHFNVAPDDVNWAHAGDLGRVMEMLREVVMVVEGGGE